MASEHHHGDGHRQSLQGQHEHGSSFESQQPADPYPLIYSRDPWDERRWNRASSEGPSTQRVGRVQLLFTLAILGGTALLSVLAITAQVHGSARP